VIQNFADKDTERLYRRNRVPKFAEFERVAQRRLAQLNAATSLHDLKGPGLSLEKLRDDREGQHAIRINQKSRVCFVWVDGHAHDVEIVVDYH
jgi:proteic killer suppression protein